MSGNSEAIVGRHARAIRIMTCLQAGPAFNAKELAQRMNVSRRTIYRDLNLIRDAGIGVKFDNEYSGYKVSQTAPNLITPPAFTDRDLIKLALTSHFSLLTGFSDMATAVRESMARLLAHYPAKMRDSIWRMLNCCSVELPQPKYCAQSLDVVETLLWAIAEHKQVRVELKARKRKIESVVATRIAPYRLIAGLHGWTLIGRSSLHRRTVRIETADIVSIDTTNEEYHVPHGYRARRVKSTV